MRYGSFLKDSHKNEHSGFVSIVDTYFKLFMPFVDPRETCFKSGLFQVGLLVIYFKHLYVTEYVEFHAQHWYMMLWHVRIPVEYHGPGVLFALHISCTSGHSVCSN